MWPLFIGADAELYFTAHPKDNCVIAGRNAYFRCKYEGTSSIPNWPWIMNGERVLSSSLPLKHSLIVTGLIVANVDMTMNNWTYACFFSIVTNSNGPRLIVSEEANLKVIHTFGE